MKKAIVKSFILGICAALSLTVTVPVMAGSVDADGFNTFRLKDGSGTIFDWGENLTLEDGKSVPSSITYDGEEYVSMSRLKEMLGDNLLMNGDSATYTFLDAGMQTEYEVVEEVEKPDVLGHIWTYQIRRYDSKPNHFGFLHVETDQYYLVVFNEEREYYRAYDLLGPNSWEFTEDCVYFAKYSEISNYYEDRVTYSQNNWDPPSLESALTLVKLQYRNTPDYQDGEVLYEFDMLSSFMLRSGYPYLSDGILYYSNSWYQGNGMGHGFRYYNNIILFEYKDLRVYPKNLIELDREEETVKIRLVQDGYIWYESYPWGKVNYYKYKLDGSEEAVQLSEDEYSKDFIR